MSSKEYTQEQIDSFELPKIYKTDTIFFNLKAGVYYFFVEPITGCKFKFQVEVDCQ